MLTVFMFIYIVIRTYLHTVFEIYTSPKLTANAPEHFVWLSNTIKLLFWDGLHFSGGELSVMLVSGRVGRDSFQEVMTSEWLGGGADMKKPGLDSFLGQKTGVT